MIKTTYIKDLPVIEIDNFLSKMELKKILSARLSKFKKANSLYPNYYRNNDRLEEINEELSSELFEKIEALNIFNDNKHLKPKRLNEKIRFCRYQKGQKFTSHQDGFYYPNEKEESKMTFLLYLNDGESFEKGKTLFFEYKGQNKPTYEIIPKQGKLVIFAHQIWHEGELIQSGCKYILRSDLIFLRTSKPKHHDGYIWNLLNIDNKILMSCGRDTLIKSWTKKDILIRSQN